MSRRRKSKFLTFRNKDSKEVILCFEEEDEIEKAPILNQQELKFLRSVADK